jgi:hypothetical protein
VVGKTTKAPGFHTHRGCGSCRIVEEKLRVEGGDRAWGRGRTGARGSSVVLALRDRDRSRMSCVRLKLAMLRNAVEQGYDPVRLRYGENVLICAEKRAIVQEFKGMAIFSGSGVAERRTAFQSRPFRFGMSAERSRTLDTQPSALHFPDSWLLIPASNSLAPGSGERAAVRGAAHARSLPYPLWARFGAVFWGSCRRKCNGNGRTVISGPWRKLRTSVGMRPRGGNFGNLAGFLAGRREMVARNVFSSLRERDLPSRPPLSALHSPLDSPRRDRNNKAHGRSAGAPGERTLGNRTPKVRER